MPIYFDLTDLLEYARDHTTVSGIQRVSLTLLSNLVNKHGPDNVRVIARHPIFGDIRSYRSDIFTADYQYEMNAFIEHFQLRLGVDQFCAANIGGNWIRSAWAVAIRTVNSVGGGRLFGALHIVDHATVDRCLLSAADVEFASGDIVYISGATWGYPALCDYFDSKRRTHGIVVIQCIYDLIAVTSPQYCAGSLPRIFTEWLERLRGQVDGFIAISEATRGDLETWMTARGTSLPIRVVPMAHQFGISPQPWLEAGVASASAAEPDRRAIRETVQRLVHEPYVLCVGTMETRKNNLSLAQAWQRLKEQLGNETPRLVFAGSKGWLNQPFEQFLATTDNLDGTIVIVERAFDPELALLYRHSLFSAFVSHVEGWGLPIGEALWFGRPVLCSNVSSMPEVGGELCDYADPTSVASIAAGALRLITDDDYRERRAAAIQAATLRSWADVADDLWAALHDPKLVTAQKS